MTDLDLGTVLGALLLLIGSGGLLAWVKFRPEAAEISVRTMTQVIESLTGENKRLSDRVSDLERKQAEFDALRDRIDQLEDELDRERAAKTRLAEEKTRLERRVADLEDQVEALKSGGGPT